MADIRSVRKLMEQDPSLTEEGARGLLTLMEDAIREMEYVARDIIHEVRLGARPS